MWAVDARLGPVAGVNREDSGSHKATFSQHSLCKEEWITSTVLTCIIRVMDASLYVLRRIRGLFMFLVTYDDLSL